MADDDDEEAERETERVHGVEVDLEPKEGESTVKANFFSKKAQSPMRPSAQQPDSSVASHSASASASTSIPTPTVELTSISPAASLLTSSGEGAVPYLRLCDAFSAIEGISGRLEITAVMTALFEEVHLFLTQVFDFE